MLLFCGKVNFALKTRKTPHRDETGKIKDKGKVNLEQSVLFFCLYCPESGQFSC